MAAGYRTTDTCVRCGRAIERGRAAITSEGAICDFCEPDVATARSGSSVVLWIVAALIVLIGGGGVAGWLLLRDTTVPWRVLVVVSGGSDTTEDAVRSRVVQSLRDIGFDAEPGPESTPAEVEGLDDGLAAARAMDAGFLVHVRIDVVQERPGIASGRTFVVTEARTRVHPTTGDEPPSDEHLLTFATEGVGRVGAMGDLERAWGTVIASKAAGELYVFERLRTRLEEARTVDDMATLKELHDSLTAAQGQRRTEERYAELCLEQTDELVHDAETGERQVTCLSSGCDEEYLFAVTADGQNAVVHVESPTIFVPFRASPSPARAETVERIELRPFDGSAPRVLAWARNFYSYGSISRDGSTLAFVEAGDAFGLVVVDTDSGERRVLHVVDGRDRILAPEVSHDGSLVLFYQDAGRHDAGSLEVITTDGESEPFNLGRGAQHARWVHMSLRPGEDAQALVAAIFERDLAAPDRLAHAVLVDPSDPSNHTRVGGTEHPVSEIAGDRDGVLYLGYRDGRRCGVGTWRPGDDAVRWIDTEPCVDRLQVTGAGTLVGSAPTRVADDPATGDDEIVELDPETGAVRPLTFDTRRDRYPRVPVEGDRVAFERLSDSQFRRLSYSAVCFVER